MIDVRDFFEAAAPAPVTALDVEALLRRGRGRSWRRLAAWLAGGVVVVVTAAGAPQLAPAGREVQTDRSRPAVSDADASDGGDARDAVGAGGERAAAARADGPLATARQGADGATSAASAPVVRTATPGLLEGCEVAEGESCSFVASAPGGYIAQGPNWSISIERDGFTYVYSSAVDELCRDIGFIDRGDKVTLYAGPSAPDPAWPPPARLPDSSPHEGPSSIRAGTNAHCASEDSP